MSFEPKSILVPVALDPEDDIELASFAVNAACDLAEKFSSNVILLNISPLMNPGGNASIDVSGKIYHALTLVLQARLSRGRMKLKELQNIVTKRGLKCEGKVVDSFEKTANAVCDAATELGVDLVVISSHGRKGLKRVFLGSVAERIVHLSPVPVLLLHQEESAEVKES